MLTALMSGFAVCSYVYLFVCDTRDLFHNGEIYVYHQKPSLINDQALQLYTCVMCVLVNWHLLLVMRMHRHDQVKSSQQQIRRAR